MQVRAVQGDTIDSLCYRYLGQTHGLVETTLARNPGLATLGPILPEGTSVDLPSLVPASFRPTVKLWD